jgi:hypothetical protein
MLRVHNRPSALNRDPVSRYSAALAEEIRGPIRRFRRSEIGCGHWRYRYRGSMARDAVHDSTRLHCCWALPDHYFRRSRDPLAPRRGSRTTEGAAILHYFGHWFPNCATPVARRNRDSSECCENLPHLHDPMRVPLPGRRTDAILAAPFRQFLHQTGPIDLPVFAQASRLRVPDSESSVLPDFQGYDLASSGSHHPESPDCCLPGRSQEDCVHPPTLRCGLA